MKNQIWFESLSPEQKQAVRKNAQGGNKFDLQESLMRYIGFLGENASDSERDLLRKILSFIVESA